MSNANLNRAGPAGKLCPTRLYRVILLIAALSLVVPALAAGPAVALVTSAPVTRPTSTKTSTKNSQPKSATATAGDEAVAYQIDAAHDGTLSGGAELPPLTEKWTRNLGGSISYPLITDGMVFVTAVAASGTNLYAFDAATGDDVWGPVSLGGTYWWSALAAGGGDVFALNYDGVLQAFDLLTGTQQWIVQLPGQYSFTSPPTYADGVVYSGGAGEGGTVYANRASDGTLLWTDPVENGDDSSPAVSSAGVYVSYACAQTYDFNPVTGAQIWHYSTSCEGGGGKTPVLGDGQLWVRDPDTGSVVLNASNGALTHTFSAGPAPAIDGTTGFFLDGSVLQALNVATMAPVWSFSGDGDLVSAPIVDNGFVYEASSSGTVWALNESTGATVWSGNAGSAIDGPDEQNVSAPLTGLAAGDGLVVVPASDDLVAYQSAYVSPAITSAVAATFTVGDPGSFDVVTTGYPVPTVTETGTLPAGVTFDSAAATLSGTPAQGSAGNYPITITSSNGIGTDASQSFVLTVNQATLSYPTNGQTDVDTTSPFTWTTIPQAQGYDLIVGTSQYGANLVNSGILPATQSSYAVPALPVGPTLYATLFTKVNGAWTSYQETSFTAAPGAATLTFPLNGEIGVDPTAPFTWSTIPHAQAYILVVGSSQFGSNLVDSGVLAATDSSFATPVLPADETLYATLLTKVNGAFTRYEAITFTTGPAMGTLTRPLNGQLKVATPTTFTWNRVAAAENYDLVVGTTLYGQNLVSSGVLPATQSSFAIPALPGGEVLYATLLTEINGQWVDEVVGFTAS